VPRQLWVSTGSQGVDYPSQTSPEKGEEPEGGELISVSWLDPICGKGREKAA